MEKLVRCKNLPKKINPIVRKNECPLILGRIKVNDNCRECPFNPSYIKDSKAKTIKPKFSVSSSKLFQTQKDMAVDEGAITTEQAINRLSRVALIPEENIRIYLHLYEKINQVEADSRSLIEGLKNLNKIHLQLLQEAVKYGWLTRYETSLLWHLWQYFMTKEGNRNKFSIKVLTDIITNNLNGEKPKTGRRANPAIEFLFMSLKEDAKMFGGKPHYSQISDLLSSLKGVDRYDVLTLRGKKEKPVLANNALTLCKSYFDAKGEPFLPDPPPIDPQGHVRHILENLSLIPMPETRPLGIDISRLKRMNPHRKESSR